MAIAMLAVAAPAQAMPGLAEATLFPLAASVHANSIAFGPDGELWFAGTAYSNDTTVVGRLEADGSVTEYPIAASPPPYGASSIVSGPDGAMWFTETGANAIGRVSASGEITHFPLRAGARPSQMVTGPDGNLWFTEPSAGRIGRMTPSGEVSEFQLGRRSHPYGVAVGPDGNVWFTLLRASKIGRITPSGKLSLYRLARATEPRQIVAASGRLWFTEGSLAPRGRNGLNRLGRITVGGRIKQFHVPAPVGTNAIAAGPEGSIWFTAGPRWAAIESISPSGELGPSACLDGDCTLPPSSLSFAPDGVLWFGTGVRACVYCGGGTRLHALQEPGAVGHLGAR